MTRRAQLIPRPVTLEEKAGEVILGPEAEIVWSGSGAEEIATLLAESLSPATGFAWPVRGGSAGTKTAVALIRTGADAIDAAGFEDERYTLEAKDNLIRIEAASVSGLARGIQALRQLLPPEIFAVTPQSARWAVPCVRIEDAPRFRWRGLHLDVCRHFFSLADVQRYIDLLALHRMNICHLHLTEDQGWRIEIKRYPRLAEVGSRRDATLIGHESARPRRYDDTPYGGFFTQAEIRELVAFAARRRVTLVPEIDMPGHMQAAIAAYPELGNGSAPLRPRCHWGISQSVLNVEESTVRFMQNVLDEVMDLFPGRFIHVGGDEAPKIEWAESRRAQIRMAELSLKNEEELQSWFIRQMDRHIAARGRRLIGWDEILEGGLAEGAAVMSWRGEKGGIAAAGEGHDVVMAPGEWTYFDHYQGERKSEEPLAIGGMLTTEKVYAYEPIPAALPPERHRHVLGSQGQLWTEYIGDRDSLDYMAYPRASALAEVTWAPAGARNYADFLERLAVHRRRLVALGVNAHPRP